MAVLSAERVAQPSQSPDRTRWVGLALAAAVVIAWGVLLWRTGSPSREVARWAVAVGLGVLAPGFAVVRAGRREAAPLVEDLSWAAAAGALVALAGWFVDRVLPWSPGALVFGPLVVAATLVRPGSRRRVLARPAPGWGPGPATALAVANVAALAWMAQTGLLAYRADPGRHGRNYFVDLLYQLDLVGELRHHLVPTYPSVAGTSLSYHWFAYAIDSHLLTHTGVDPFDSTLRLLPATLVPAILMLAAVVARRLARQVWAGPVAAGMLGLLGISQATRWSVDDGSSTGVLLRYWLFSLPQTLGWFTSLAVAGALTAFLRRDPDDRATPVALLVPLLILAAGSKSSELPVIAGGLALALLVALIRRDRRLIRRCLAALVLTLVVFEAAALTIYGGSSYGVRLDPFGWALQRLPVTFPGYGTQVSPLFLTGTHWPLIATASTAVLWLLPLLPRLLGGLLQLRCRGADPAGWVFVGTGATGVALTLLVRHPAGSELYFMESGYPIGVAGAASGIVLAAARLSRGATVAQRRRLVGGLGVLVAVGALLAVAIASTQGRHDPVTAWKIAHPGVPMAGSVSALDLAWRWLRPTAILLLIIAAVSPLALLAVRRVSRRPASALLVVVCLVLGPGLFDMALHFKGAGLPALDSRAQVAESEARARRAGEILTTRPLVRAGRYVDAHAGADDVVASNLFCRLNAKAVARSGRPCDARNFLAAAWTQRRSLVGGWAYADRNVASAWTRTRVYRETPFWDPALLEEQSRAYLAPTASLLDDLYRRHGVRWLFLDLKASRVDVRALDQLADLRFRATGMAVYHLRAPRP